jgi:hypothetical protein
MELMKGKMSKMLEARIARWSGKTTEKNLPGLLDMIAGDTIFPGSGPQP